MILELSQAAIRDQAKAAVVARGTRTVPTLDEHGQPGAGWALADVLAHIDRADVVRWDDAGEILVVTVRGDYVRRFAVQRRDVVDVDGLGEVVPAVMVCEPCELRGDVAHPAPAAAYLAGVHDQVAHGGGRTARAVPMLLVRVGDWCLPAEQLQEMREWAAECPWRDLDPDDLLDEDLVPDHVVVAGVETHYQGTSPDGTDGVAGFLVDAGLRVELVRALRSRPRPPWEVDDVDGTPLYRGADLGLADELAHLTPGSHLVELGVSA